MTTKRQPYAVPGETEADTHLFFDIVVERVIGRVLVDESGGFADTPHEAAFKMIAREDTEGTYKFPMRNGQMCHVSVEYAPELS